jgi:molecular chaperone DnaJ/curved DNA-binding protein
MHAIRDYYALLEVGEGADSAEIKRAYHRLARRYHPDTTGGDVEAAERFRTVHAAYAVLTDPLRRRLYDRARGKMAADGASNGVQAQTVEGLDAEAFSALFDQMADAPLSAEPAAAPSFQGKDVALQVRLTFRQALVGGATTVRLPTGHTFRLPVPRGARHGLKIRVPGQNAGADGDLYVTFRVEPDSRFRREGDDLHVVECVSALEAMLGSARSLMNAYSQVVRLPIPPGTQPGDRLRLRGQGVETGTSRGDLYVEVQVEVPRDLTDEQRAVLVRAARRCGLL